MADDPVAYTPTWADVSTLAGALAGCARADGLPDVVLGLARGGLVPAVIVSHQLGIRDLRCVGVAHTASDVVASPKTDRPVVADPASLGTMTGLDVLVIDDVAGTGHSLGMAADLARGRGAARVRVAVVVVNNLNWFAANDLPPEATIDYVGISCAGWVVFPWEPADQGSPHDG